MASETATKARAAARHRVLKSGIVAYQQRGSTMPCAVRDFSIDGARLIFEPGLSPPNAFDLIIAMDGIEAACVVKWRRGHQVGVAFATDLRASVHQRKQSLIPTRPEQKPTLRRKVLAR